MTARTSTTWPPLPSSATVSLDGVLEGACWLLSLFPPFVGLVLWTRYVTGSLASPPATVVVLVMALGTLVAVGSVRLLCHIRRRRHHVLNRWDKRMVRWGPTVGLVLLALVLPVLGADIWPIICFTLLAAGEEAWAWCWFFRRVQGTGVSASTIPAGGNAVRVPPDELVNQSWSRSTAANASDVLRGWTQASFAAGARTASVHLAFCPPFIAVPEVELRQLDGPAARLKVAQLFPYGARIDVKLDGQPAKPAVVKLEFQAVRR